MLKLYIFIFTLVFTCIDAKAGDSTGKRSAETKKRINVIVSSKLKGFDAAGIGFHLQAGMKKLFHKKGFHTVYVDSIEEASGRITALALKEDAMIGNLWFDSHGHMGRRVSLVEIGNDEVNYQTIHQDYIHQALSAIARYCDTQTRIGLGSCYSGANFVVPAVEIFPEQRMNGDSLMISMSKLMNDAQVFGSKSWVMTKPGIFSRSFAMAGHPWRKRFKDPCLLSCWQELGNWVMYGGGTERITAVNTIGLNRYAAIEPLTKNFLDDPRNLKKQKNKIKKIREGNFKHKWFYQYQYPRHVSVELKKFRK